MEVASLFATLGLKPDTASWNKGDRLLKTVKTALTALAGFAAFSWAKGLVNDVVALGGKLNDLSATVGVGVEALQELGYAAQQNGSSLEGMGTSLRFLGRNMSNAKKNGGELAKAFKVNGIAYKDARGALLPVEEVLGNVADGMAKMKTPAERSALAMQLLGRSGATLVPALAGGKAGLEKLREEARATGGVIDKDGVGKLDDLGDAVDRAKFAIQGLKARAVVALAPAFTAAVDAIVGFIKANKEMLSSLGTSALAAFAVVGKGIAIAFEGVKLVFEWLGEHPKVAKALLVSIGIVLAVLAAKMAIAWAVGKLAIIGVIAALTALQVILEPILDILIEVFKTLWYWLKRFGEMLMVQLRAARAFAAKVIDAFRSIGRWAANVGSQIIDAFENAWERVKAGAKAMGEYIIDLPVIKQLIALGKFIGGVTFNAANPDKVMDAQAAPYAEGDDRSIWGEIFNSMNGNVMDLTNDVWRAGQNMGKPAAPAPSSGGTGPVAMNATINATVNAAPGMDEVGLADMVGREVRRSMEPMLRDAAAEVG
jgi:hypothetical protein